MEHGHMNCENGKFERRKLEAQKCHHPENQSGWISKMVTIEVPSSSVEIKVPTFGESLGYHGPEKCKIFG